MFYVEKDDKIVLIDESRSKLIQTLALMPQFSDGTIKESSVDIVNFEGDFYFVDDEEYIRKKDKADREELDSLSLTPADVERALYRAKKMDFEDLKTLISNMLPTVDLKALSIEFRAKDFYRGAVLDGGFDKSLPPYCYTEDGKLCLFNAIGGFLGYSPQDMDYLFKYKHLPDDIESEVM